MTAGDKLVRQTREDPRLGDQRTEPAPADPAPIDAVPANRPALPVALIATIACSSHALAQPPVRPAQLSDAEIEALEGGEILVDVDVSGPITRGVVTALIDGAAGDVWAVVADFADQDEWIPDMYDADIVSGTGASVVGAAKMRLPFPLRDREYTLAIEYDQREVGGIDSYVSTWDYVEGNMDANSGYWLVQPWGGDDRTLVVYEFEAASGIPSPDGIEERVTSRTMPGIMEGLRDRVAQLY